MKFLRTFVGIFVALFVLASIVQGASLSEEKSSIVKRGIFDCPHDCWGDVCKTIFLLWYPDRRFSFRFFFFSFLQPELVQDAEITIARYKIQVVVENATVAEMLDLYPCKVVNRYNKLLFQLNR